MKYHPESIFKAFVQFEREEGTIEHLDRALDRVRARAEQIEQQAEQMPPTNQRWPAKRPPPPFAQEKGSSSGKKAKQVKNDD